MEQRRAGEKYSRPKEVGLDLAGPPGWDPGALFQPCLTMWCRCVCPLHGLQAMIESFKERRGGAAGDEEEGEDEDGGGGGGGRARRGAEEKDGDGLVDEEI